MTKCIVFLPFLAAALSASAQAQEVSVNVGYGDLDLTGETGVERLDRRIHDAVEQVCGDPFDQRELRAARASRKCGRESLADVASPRQIAIERARGRVPSVEIADSRKAMEFAVTRRGR
ncbi:MAG: UrcA family protein [Novosphingobium sp.]|nr:UrcA family protein [Novosphingobium sp.]